MEPYIPVIIVLSIFGLIILVAKRIQAPHFSEVITKEEARQYREKLYGKEETVLTAMDDNRGRSGGYFYPSLLVPPGTSAEAFSDAMHPFEGVRSHKAFPIEN